MGAFEQAGQRLIDSLTQALYEAGADVFAVTQVEVPRSDAMTYVPIIRTVGGERRYYGDDPYMEAAGDDNGTLQRSGRLFPPVREGDSVSVTLGYGFGEEPNPRDDLARDYVYWVHEVAEYRHEPPTKDHFLSDPVVAFAPEMAPYLAVRVKEVIVLGETPQIGEDFIAGSQFEQGA